MPAPKPTSLVLASGSPRRKELLGFLGVPFEVIPADLDETQRPHEAAAAYVARLSQEKAAAVLKRKPGALVLAADTSVVVDGEVLGKPRDAEDGRHMLRKLSGRSHVVMTGVALAGTHTAHTVVHTEVTFRALSDAEIAWYVATGEGSDKAGGYASQARAGAFVERLQGSSTNVIGLPLSETVELLKKAGVTFAWSAH